MKAKYEATHNSSKLLKCMMNDIELEEMNVKLFGFGLPLTGKKIGLKQKQIGHSIQLSSLKKERFLYERLFLLMAYLKRQMSAKCSCGTHLLKQDANKSTVLTHISAQFHTYH